MNYTALITGTVLIGILSWFLSLKHKRYHGIPRFFSFLSIYILFLLNLDVWFHNPFVINQIVSWSLLILSVYVALAGFLLLKKHGRSEKNFENTTMLVKSGIYGFIRHPLYLSLFLLGTGVMMKDTGTIQILLGIVNFVSLYFTAKIEEKEMIRKFGTAYEEYINETKMFIPFVF